MPPLLRETSERLDRVLRELDAHPDEAVRGLLHEAVELLMTLHGAAFEQVLALGADPALGGHALVNRLADDPLIGPLLVTHGLHPYGVEVRAARAVDRLRPQIAAQGCRATLVGVEEGVARVRVAGTPPRDADPPLAALIETAVLDAAPELTGVVVDAAPREPAAPPALIQIVRKPDEAANLGAATGRST